MSTKKRDPAVAAFMAEVMRGMNVATVSDLTDRMLEAKMLRSSQVRSVSRWVTGESAPSHRPTLWLLQQAGMLKAATQAEGASAGDETPVDPLAKIADGVAAILENQQELLRLARGGDAPGLKPSVPTKTTGGAR